MGAFFCLKIWQLQVLVIEIFRGCGKVGFSVASGCNAKGILLESDRVYSNHGNDP